MTEPDGDFFTSTSFSDVQSPSPHVNHSIGMKKVSGMTNNTFISMTTRASSVMPATKHNLGMTSQNIEALDEDNLRGRYNLTSVGVKNEELGRNVIPATEARELNQLTTQEANNAIKPNKENPFRRLDKSTSSRKYLIIMASIFVLIGVIVSIALVARDNDNLENGDDELQEDDEIDDLDDLFVPFNSIDEDIFTNICQAIDSDIEFGVCISFDNFLICDDNEIISNNCGAFLLCNCDDGEFIDLRDFEEEEDGLCSDILNINPPPPCSLIDDGNEIDLRSLL